MGGPTYGMIKAGRFKPIGVASKARHPSLPDVPALSEYKDLANFEYSQWAGVLAPPNTPDAVTARVVEAMNAWVGSPENRTRRTVNLQRAIEPMTMAQAQSFLTDEHAKLTRIARSLKLAGQ
jgi:tripartite-type tricarboxylate transporter receptor subunit TctC